MENGLKKLEADLLKKLSIADLERANAYAKDLGRGLQIVRSFPQGVTIFGSARLAQEHKYCKMAFELGRMLAENGHAVITGGGPGISFAWCLRNRGTSNRPEYHTSARAIPESFFNRLCYIRVLLCTKSIFGYVG